MGSSLAAQAAIRRERCFGHHVTGGKDEGTRGRRFYVFLMLWMTM
jgi:hypothetical protein